MPPRGRPIQPPVRRSERLQKGANLPRAYNEPEEVSSSKIASSRARTRATQKRPPKNVTGATLCQKSKAKRSADIQKLAEDPVKPPAKKEELQSNQYTSRATGQSTTKRGNENIETETSRKKTKIDNKPTKDFPLKPNSTKASVAATQQKAPRKARGTNIHERAKVKESSHTRERDDNRVKTSTEKEDSRDILPLSKASAQNAKKRGNDKIDTGRAKKSEISQGPVDISPETYEIVKDLAKKGGPDLSDIRGFNMSETSRRPSQRNKRRPSHYSPDPFLKRKRSKNAKSTIATGYLDSEFTEGNKYYGPTFTERANKNGIIFPGNTKGDETPYPWPVNFEEISLVMRKKRNCTDLCQEEVRKDLHTLFCQLVSRTRTQEVLKQGPFNHLIGFPLRKYYGVNLPFDRLETFPDKFRTFKPDYYEGGKRNRLEIDDDDLISKVVPTTSSLDPILPNFIVEIKPPLEHGKAAINQIVHAGVNCARSVRALQQYKIPKFSQTYDNKAHTICATFDGLKLQLFTVHIQGETGSKEEPLHIIKSLGTWLLTEDINSYVDGITAFRNLSDWTERERNSIIDGANRRAVSPQAKRQANSKKVSKVAEISTKLAIGEEENENDRVTTSFSESNANGNQSPRRNFPSNNFRNQRGSLRRNHGETGQNYES